MLEEEVRRARREERDVEDVTVEGECLAGADLSGLEFRRVRLHRCGSRTTTSRGRSLTGWSGAAATSPTAASAGRSGRIRWCGTGKGDGGRFTAQPVAGLYPGRERLPLRQFYTVAVEKVPHGELPASPGRAGRGGCGRTEPTPDGVPGGGLFPATPLKGVDFSDCALEGITVSESLGELRGMKINPAQAVDLIPLLGIQLL